MVERAQSRAWRVLAAALAGWNQNEGFVRSAAMAYYSALSLLPLCLVLMAVLGLVARYSTVAQLRQQDLLSLVEQTAGSWLAGQLQTVLAGVQNRAAVNGPLGLAMLLVTAAGVFAQFEGAIDRIWGRTSRGGGLWRAIRNVLVDRLTAFVMVLGLAAVLMTVLVLNLVLSGLQGQMAAWPLGAYAWHGAHTLLTPVVYTAALTIIYRVLPRAGVRWFDAACGGLLAALAWWLGQHVLTWLVIGERYTAYGAVGALLAVLVWQFYACVVLLFGAEVVRAGGKLRAASAAER